MYADEEVPPAAPQLPAVPLGPIQFELNTPQKRPNVRVDVARPVALETLFSLTPSQHGEKKHPGTAAMAITPPESAVATVPLHPGGTHHAELADASLIDYFGRVTAPGVDVLRGGPAEQVTTDNTSAILPDQGQAEVLTRDADAKHDIDKDVDSISHDPVTTLAMCASLEPKNAPASLPHGGSRLRPFGAPQVKDDRHPEDSHADGTSSLDIVSSSLQRCNPLPRPPTVEEPGRVSNSAATTPRRINLERRHRTLAEGNRNVNIGQRTSVPPCHAGLQIQIQTDVASPAIEHGGNHKHHRDDIDRHDELEMLQQRHCADSMCKQLSAPQINSRVRRRQDFAEHLKTQPAGGWCGQTGAEVFRYDHVLKRALSFPHMLM